MIYNKIIECTLINDFEVRTNSAMLICTNEQFESIDIRDDFFFNNSFKIIDITNTIDLEDIGDLYKYLLEKNIYINSERILNRGILVGEEANVILQENLKIEQIS